MSATNRKLVCFNLQIAIAAILDGAIAEEQIEKIITETMYENYTNWDDLIKIYRRSHWFDNPDEGEAILRRLLAAEKIIQPLLGEQLGALEGHIPMRDGYVSVGKIGSLWIDAETFESVNIAS